MIGDEIWSAFVGPEHGPALRSALMLLMMIPPDVMREGVEKINRELAIGPLLNPSAYVDGQRYRNGEQYRCVLELALRLRIAMEERKGGE